MTAETPPAYLSWASNDNTVKPANSTMYKRALTNAGVPVTTKTFSTGGHGFGFNTSFSFHNVMLKDLKEWLLGLEGLIDGIGSVPGRQSGGNSSSAVYNLAGQRVGTPQHGIFITGNKKVLVR